MIDGESVKGLRKKFHQDQ